MLRKDKEMNMKLSAKEIYSYGLGALGKDMVCGLIFTYCMIYFTDVLKLSASFVGTLFFFAKFWDAVNDLGMGMIVDNTKTKWGKFRPWLAIGTLINAVIFVCLFTNFHLSGTSLYIFAAVMYILWGMTYTIMDIPYWSMLPNLTQDPVQRDRLAVIPRIFASIGGSLLVGGFGLQIMDVLGQGNAQQGYTRFAWVIAIVFVIGIGFTVCNVKSADKTTNVKQDKTSFRKMIKIIKENDQLHVAIAVILTFNFAMQIITGISTYYFIYVAGSKSMFSVFTMFAGFAEILGLLLFPKIAKKIRKDQVYFFASGIPIIGLSILLITGFIAPQNMILTALSGIGVKFGSGLQLGIVTVVLANVVDYGEYKFGTRNESITFSIQTLLVKFTSAMGALCTGFALDITGYLPNATQSMATIQGIRFLMIGIPMIFVVLSYIIYKTKFQLHGAYYNDIMEALNQRKKEITEQPKEDILEQKAEQVITMRRGETYANTVS